MEFSEADGVGSATSPDVVRLIMYQDKQANGAVATALNILETDNYQSFRNLTETGRFTILMDNTVDLNPRAGGGNGTTSDWAGFTISGSFFKKCNIPLEFSAGTGAITELRSNNVGVLILGKVGGIVTLDSKVRVRFSDR